MKASITSILLATLAGSAIAQNQRINTSKYNEDYLRAANAPNAVGMKELRQRKMALRESEASAGVFDKDRYKKVSSATSCTNGKAGGYSCNNVDLLGFLRHQDMGSRTREGNDIWGMFHNYYKCAKPILTYLLAQAGHMRLVVASLPSKDRQTVQPLSKSTPMVA
jgi:hypothetical protein